MGEIERLLGVAARRADAGDRTSVRVALSKAELAELRSQLESDGVSMGTLFRAVIRGYLGRHPAVMAMVDDATRDLVRSEAARVLSRRQLDEIYAAIGGDTVTDEEG